VRPRILPNAAAIEVGPLFRAVNKAGRPGGALDAGQVARVFKEMAQAAGLGLVLQPEFTRVRLWARPSVPVGASCTVLMSAAPG
jgi:hypothetical protein